MIRMISALFVGLFFELSAFADGAPAGMPAGAPQAPSAFGMFLPLVVVFAIFYFLTIRPQQKKFREQQDMLKSLKSGDDVLTAAGILGKVAGLTEKFVTLEVANNVKIKVLRSQVTQILKGDGQELTT